MYRIGVDVGGTNTDSALLDVTAVETLSRGVLASSKTSTTTDVTSGIRKAIEDVLATSKVRKSDVLSVHIGTTHFVNAVVEADERRLSKVAVVRICGPYTRQIPPFSGFPIGLGRILNGGVWYVDGGLDINGREITPFNPEQIEKAVAEIKRAGISSVAVVGVFSPLDHSGMHEERCKRIMLDTDSSLSITCSRDIGPPGLLERENATILNASILAVAKKTINGFQKAMLQLHLTCALYLTQNDGTLTDVESALKFPIKCFASGPTNSAIGAAFLAGLDKPNGPDSSEKQQQVIVIDIGGTTTDLCALLPSGFPRQAPGFVEVGGVRTMFSMPEVYSIAFGGGSRVSTGDKSGKVTFGPDSVAHFLTSRSMVFGGNVMTSTDIAVALGRAKLGDESLVSKIPKSLLESARKEIKTTLEVVIDRMKVSADPVTVLLVGGGSLLFLDDLSGVAEYICPPHHGSANAVGAAMAKVAGEIDIIEILEGKDEKEVVKEAGAKAIDVAVRKGAARDNVKVVEVDKIPLQYVANKATRIIIKATGSLKTPKPMETPEHSPAPSPEPAVYDDDFEFEDLEEPAKENAQQDSQQPATKQSLNINIATYRPDVRKGVWYVSEVDLEFIASGTGVLGTGGGGSSYVTYLAALDALHQKGPGSMRVISLEALQDSDLCCYGSWYGAPSSMNERLCSGSEVPVAIDTTNRVLGYTDFQALLTDEIGGGNGLASFPSAVHYDKPLVDGDSMGRAYPSMEHNSLGINGFPITPCTLADANGNVSIVMEAESPKRLEKLLRQTAIELGLGCAVAQRPIFGSAVRKYAVPRTVSHAWYLGRAIHLARKLKTGYVEAIFDTTPGRLLFSGKVVDVRRDIEAGYTMGRCIIAPVSENDQMTNSVPKNDNVDNRHLVIPFQNEYLYAAYTDSNGTHETEVICTVPDLISILDQDGEGIGSQDLRYGLKVNVIAMPAHPLWTASKRGLQVGGPEGFGLDMPFTSVGDYIMPRSVIDDFNV